ncbi:effector-associated constant component EACC1 [Streptomyces hawaiiensis]|uniref:effector-associated constant component EACC1 n=1 Tax=Streptomyces hawaiiensis TaxID=67305 RepID=UPI0036487EAE
MQIRVLADGDELGLADLQSWLRQDAGTARLPVAPVAPEHASTMSVLEALDIILSNTVAITNFAVAYATWREAKAQRPGSGARTLVHGASTVDISHLSAEELTELLNRLGSEGPTSAGRNEA